MAGIVTPWANVNGCPSPGDVAIVLEVPIEAGDSLTFGAIVSDEAVSESILEEQERLSEEAAKVAAAEQKERLVDCGFGPVFVDGDVAIYSVN